MDCKVKCDICWIQKFAQRKIDFISFAALSKAKGMGIEMFEVKKTKDLTSDDIRNMMLIAQKFCSETYMREKINVYDEAVIAYGVKSIKAFHLIQRFEEKETVYVYMGPLFSLRNAYLPMFDFFYNWIQEENENKQLYLMGEIQHPEILLVFTTLFGEYSYPQIKSSILPTNIVDAAQKIANRYDHIQEFNVERFSTYSSVSLYQQNHIYSEVRQWLERRGIFFEKGFNQVLVVSVPSENEERLVMNEKYQESLMMFHDWKNNKWKMLQQFQEG